MKIVVVCDVLGEINNGTTKVAYNLINFLKNRGHSVTVVCSDQDKKNLEGFVVLNKLYIPIINWVLKRNGVSLSKIDKKLLEKAIRGCDVVHSILPFKVGSAAAKIAQKYNIPVTVGFHCQAENFTCHIGMKKCKPANRLLYKFFNKRIYKHADAIHYPTQFIKDDFESVVGEGSALPYVISNGVSEEIRKIEAEKPANLKDKFVLFSVGRFCGEKSHMTILKAVAKSKYADKIQLIFAGNGPLYNKIKKYAKKHLPVQPIMGFLPRDEMVRIFNYSDLYIHPAEIELEGIACLEAIACGLVPIVSDSNRAATKNFALSENNMCKCNNPESLKEKIEYWLEHPQQREEYSKKYLNFAVRFDQTECMEKMEKMLFDVIKNRAKAQS